MNCTKPFAAYLLGTEQVEGLCYISSTDALWRTSGLDWNCMNLSAAKPTLLQINKCNCLFLKFFFSCEHCTVLLNVSTFLIQNEWKKKAHENRPWIQYQQNQYGTCGWTGLHSLVGCSTDLCCLEAVWEGRATSAMEWFFLLEISKQLQNPE